MPVTGTVFNIARGSLHDGEGIRTVVYFKGCSLRCAWCQNPEGLAPEKQILFMADRCIGCGRCVSVCGKCHQVQGETVVFLRGACAGCGRCAAVCPVNALVLCGETMSPRQIVDEIIRDKHYYDRSGGGVTFSGGECLLQPEFLKETLALCKEQGINTAIETALHVPYEYLEPLLPLLDTVLADFKHPDTGKHKEFTGAGNERIMENLRKLSRSHGNILVRIPLVPGVNDGEETLCKAVEIIHGSGGGIKGMELLKYNNLYKQKVANIGETARFFCEQIQSDETMRNLCGMLNQKLGKPSYVFFTA